MPQTPEQAKAWYLANRERVLAQQREWKQQNRDKVAAQDARRYARDPEKARTSARNRMRGRGDAALRSASFRAAHPEYARVKNAARKQHIGRGDLTPQQWQEILQEFDHTCAYCQARGVQLELEHMTPLSRGGRHTKDNVVPACRDCNGRKRARTIFEFLAVA